MQIFLGAILALVLGTSAYAQTGPRVNAPPVRSSAQATNPFAVLDQFVIDDLNAAMDDAKAHNDTMATACYEALIPVVQHHQAQVGGAGPKGALFTLFQKARDVKRAVSAGVPDNISAACAPLVLDAEQTLLRLGTLVGVKIALPIPLP